MLCLIRRAFVRPPLRVQLRAYASQVSPPPPPPLPSADPVVTTYSSPARPRPYPRPQRRDLPLPRKRWPLIAAVAVGGVLSWAAFLTYVTNQEKISSSVVRQIMRSVKQDPELRERLGEVIRPQPEWWLNGDPRIHGNINQLQGNVDVSFRLKGSKGSGILYFTSIRKEKGVPFTILRFKVICDDGTTVHVNSDIV